MNELHFNMKKAIDIIIDKLKLLKIIFYDFLIRKNLFINIILGLTVFIIIHFDWIVILGPFISSIITFNLVNGYLYHQKIKQWNNNKTIILYDFLMFLINLRMHIQFHKFPILEKDFSRHFDLDGIRYSKLFTNVTYKKNANKMLYNHFIYIFEEYSKYFTSIKDSKELKFNEEKFKEYSDFIEKYSLKLSQSALILASLFSDNNKIITALAELSNELSFFAEFCKSGGYKDDHDAFISDVIKIMKLAMNIIKII